MAATVTSSTLSTRTGFRNVTGNLTLLNFNLTVASGVWTLSDKATAIIVADTLILGTIPAGFKPYDMIMTVSAAFTAATTCSVGFKYVDGVDSTPAENPAYFIPATQALSATAILRKTAKTAPAKLPKDAYLTLLWAGDTDASNGVLDISLIGVYTG